MLLEICKYHVKLIYSAIYSARVYVAMLLKGFQDTRQHEVDESAGVGLGCAVVDGLVVAILVVMHHGLDRQMEEDWMKPAENKRLPKPPRPAIAVGERMDELELIVEYASPDEQMVFGMPKPVEKAGNQLRHLPSRGRDMNHLLPVENTYAPRAEFPRPIHQGRHHRVTLLQADDIALHQRGYLGDKRDRTGGKGGW